MNQFVGEQANFCSCVSLFMSAGEYSHFTPLESCSSTTDNFMNMISFPRTWILDKRRKPSVMSNEVALMCKWPCHIPLLVSSLCLLIIMLRGTLPSVVSKLLVTWWQWLSFSDCRFKGLLNPSHLTFKTTEHPPGFCFNSCWLRKSWMKTMLGRWARTF